MFRKQGFPFDADTYLNIYETCNVGCKFCKFNQRARFPIKNEIDFEMYSNLRVLVSYKTEPLPFADNSHTRWVVENLHEHGASVLFLSRFPKKVLNILDVFNEEDIVGVSISEDLKNDFESIKEFLIASRKNGVKTWLSIEPVETFEFAEFVLNEFKDFADFLRVGKLDNVFDNSTQWQQIKQKLDKKFTQKNIFIKNCY